MASPWKFLSRLVSPGRKQKPDEGTVDEAKSDVLAIAGLTETPAEENVSSANRSTAAEPFNGDSTDQVSPDTAPSGEAENKDQRIAESVGAAIAETSSSVSSDETDNAVAAPEAAKLELAVEGKARKQRDRSKTSEAVVAEPFYPAAEVVADGTLSLDAEIRVLKGQLASKLQTQNAQLKKMLERFER
jgi:hypothetical protein